MKRTKQILAIILTIILLCSCVPLVFAENSTIVDSGTCGENATWTLDNEGTLTISGTGKVTDKFSTGGIKHVVVNDGITELSDDVFLHYGSSLESLKLSDSVKTIGKEAFCECYGLSQIDLGKGLKTIKKSAFAFAAVELDIVYPATMLPDSLEVIERHAFWGCPIKTINIPKNVRSIGQEAFGWDIQRYTVSEGNPYFSADDIGCLFNKDQTNLIDFPAGSSQRTYAIPNSVIEIAPYAFSGYEKGELDSVTMGDNVEVIGEGAFFDAYFLQSITLSEKLREIGDLAFYGCIALSEITIPESVTKIGDGAFYVLPFLEKITVRSNNVTFLESDGLEMLGQISYDNPEYEHGLEFGKTPLTFSNISRDEFLSYFREMLNGVDVDTSKIEEHDHDPAIAVGTVVCHAGSTTEAYAIEHGLNYKLEHFYNNDWTYDWVNLVRSRKCIHCEEQEIEPLTIKQSSNAELIAPTDDNTTFNAVSISKDSTDYATAKEALKEWNIVKIYDLSLKNQDGVDVQPNGTVKVKLPYDFQSETYKVYRVNNDGTYIDMNAYREGSYLVFTTDHFSLYVIVDNNSQSESVTPDDGNSGDSNHQDAGKKLNFFQRIIEWFRNLFKKITSIFHR